MLKNSLFHICKEFFLSWNKQNQLTQVKNDIVLGNNGDNVAPQHTSTYKYDSLERRIETIFQDHKDSTKNTTRRFIYDNEDIIAELDESNKLIAFYVHGPGIDTPLALVRDLNKDGDFSVNEVFYYTRDHLGSVRELLDHRGVMYQRYSYGAYGETRLEKHEGSQKHKFIENRYAYTSREIDHKTGLYYYRARWYSPETGSFISADPIGFESQDTNFYRYVENNPVVFNDPFGLWTIGQGFVISFSALGRTFSFDAQIVVDDSGNWGITRTQCSGSVSEIFGVTAGHIVSIGNLETIEDLKGGSISESFISNLLPTPVSPIAGGGITTPAPFEDNEKPCGATVSKILGGAVGVSPIDYSNVRCDTKLISF